MAKYKIGMARMCVSGFHREAVTNLVMEACCQAPHMPQIADVVHMPARADYLACVPTPVARNGVAKWALEQNCDYLFMIDEDCDPPAPGFFKAALTFLFAKREKGEIALAASPYCCGGNVNQVQVFEWVTPKNKGGCALEHVTREDAAIRKGWQEVANVGTHLICYDTRLFQQIPTPWFDYQYNEDHTEVRETEDAYFGRRAYTAGGKLYVSWDHWSGHWKSGSIGKPAVLSHAEARQMLRRLDESEGKADPLIGTVTEEDIEGWYDFADIYEEQVKKAKGSACFCEIGCWKGKSTVGMARLIQKSGKPIVFVAIDHFRGSPGEKLMEDELVHLGGSTEKVFRENIDRAGVSDVVKVMVAPSLEAVKQFPDNSFDFVFVDGDHTEEAVKDDLLAWWPKVKAGGTLAGHDYCIGFPGLVDAVQKFAYGQGVSIRSQGTSWIIDKPISNGARPELKAALANKG